MNKITIFVEEEEDAKKLSEILLLDEIVFTLEKWEHEEFSGFLFTLYQEDTYA